MLFRMSPAEGEVTMLHRWKKNLCKDLPRECHAEHEFTIRIETDIQWFVMTWVGLYFAAVWVIGWFSVLFHGKIPFVIPHEYIFYAAWTIHLWGFFPSEKRWHQERSPYDMMIKPEKTNFPKTMQIVWLMSGIITGWIVLRLLSLLPLGTLIYLFLFVGWVGICFLTRWSMTRREQTDLSKLHQEFVTGLAGGAVIHYLIMIAIPFLF